MGELNIEKYFQKRLKDHSEELDTKAMWKSLDLPSNKRERPLIFWLSGIALGLLFIMLISNAWLFKDGNQNLTKKVKTYAHEKLEQDQNNPNLDSKKYTEEDSVQERKLQITNSASESLNEENAPEILKAKNNQVATPDLKEKNSPKALGLVNDGVLNNNLRPITPLPPSKKNTTSSSPTADPSSENISKSNFIFKEELETEGPDNLSKLLLASISPVHSLGYNMLETDKRAEFINTENVNFIKPIEKTPNSLSLGIYSGVYAIQRNLRTIQPEITNFVSARNQSESMLEMLELGSELKYKFKSGVYLKVGLNYQDINERFNFNQTMVDTVVVEDVIVSSFVSSNRDTMNVTENGLGVQQTFESWTSFNKHRLISLPLSLGFAIDRGRFSIYAESNLILNFSHSFIGDQLDSQLQVVNSASNFSNSFKVGYGLSLGIGYKITESLQFVLQPRYQKIIDSFTPVESGLSQKYSMYGIRAGLSYQIN